MNIQFLRSLFTEGFTLNDSSVKNKNVALIAAKDKYVNLIELGLIDPEKGIKELRDNLNKVGYDKVDKEFKA